MGKYSNISVARYRRILIALGLEYIRTKDGYEIWNKKGLLRNVVFQNHEEPVPEDIVLNNLRTIGITKKDFDEILANTK
jgi:hypothetical protein